MRSPRMCFLAMLLSAIPLVAQVVSVPPAPLPALSQTLTTAVVGFTGSQTVQLNVLNMSAATTATLAGCDVQLAFYDSQNRLLKQGTTTNIAPGATASLSLGRSDVPAASATAPRVSVRGQLRTILPPTTSGTVGELSSCSLFASLEIYDNVTGATQVFTTDARTVFAGDVVPVVLSKPTER
jgi:hypothetical protein